MTFNSGNEKLEMVADDSFPAGLRVMVVDDDPICLLILDRMLRRCSYQVTTFGRAVDALEMLRGHRDEYDLVISDVCMPDMDGFKLLELVGLEMDLPVIMMSANGETSAVMKGIKHGACDYLLKPVRIEELKNIWQHVVRKKWRASQQSSSVDDSKVRKASNDTHPVSSENEGLDGVVKQSRKRKDIKEEEEDVDQDFEDPSGTKKSRVVWSVDLHQQFVAAVNHLGIDKAVPKRILELMNVQGLTRENIASHLQKYRLYLKRINGAVHHPGGLHSPFVPSLPGSLNPSFGAASAGRFGGIGDLRSLTATGQLPSQAVLSTLQAGLLGRLDAKVSGLGDADSILMHVAALQGVNVGASGKPPYHIAALQAQPSDVKQLVQSSHAPTFPLTLAGSPSNLPVLQQKQRFETAAGLECMGQLAGLSSNTQVELHNTALMPAGHQHQSEGCVPDSLIMHTELPKKATVPALPQHQSDGCLPDSLITSTRGVEGQHGGVADEEPWVSPPSITNGAVGSCLEIQYPRSFRAVGQLGGTGSPSLLGSCENTSPFISVPNVSSPLTIPRLNSEVNIPCIQSMTGAASEGSFHSLSNLNPTFMSPAGRGQWPEPVMLLRKQAGWRGVEESHELGHSYSSLPSPKPSRGLGVGLGNGQAQAQLHSPGFSMPFAGHRSAEEIMFASSGVSPSQLKLMGLSTVPNIKEENLDGSEQLQGLPSHGLSDELLKILLKQHETGFTDG